MPSPYDTSAVPLRWPVQAMVRLLELKAQAQLVRELDGPRHPRFIRALLALDMELHSAYHLLHRQPPRTDRQAAESYGLLVVHLASVSAWLKLQV
jgi:hypothetical protein